MEKTKNLPKVAFVCVHNSCRSQIAEALGKMLASETFESFSAGTETRLQINPDAVRLMKERFNIDMEADQYSKLISDLPAIDIVITMGCNVQCPTLSCTYREDWGLEETSRKNDACFNETIDRIYEKVIELKKMVAKSVF